MKRVRTKRLVIAGLIGCGMLAVCAVGYGYVKSFRMDTPVYASVVSYRDQEGALGKTFCFEYEGADFYGAVLNSGTDPDPFFDIRVLEKRLFWWTPAHFETALFPVQPAAVPDGYAVVGCYTGWNADEAVSVTLRDEEGQPLQPRKQEQFAVNGTSYLGYAIEVERDFSGVLRFQYADADGRPLPEFSPMSVYHAAVYQTENGEPVGRIGDESVKNHLLKEAAALFASREPADAFPSPSQALVFDFPATCVKPGPSYAPGDVCTRLTVCRLDENRYGLRVEPPGGEAACYMGRCERDDTLRAYLEGQGAPSV